MKGAVTMLYHKDVFLPEVAKRLSFAVLLRYGPHAKQAAKNDRYGQIDLPVSLDTRKGELIEVEVQGNRVTKTVYRLPYDNRRDLCIVLSLDGFVRTVWSNLKNDSHKTLDTSKYAKG